MLLDNWSDLSIFLRKMNNQDKSRLIRALVMGDGDAVGSLLTPISKQLKIDEANLKKIFSGLSSTDHNLWLHSTVKKIIEKALTNESSNRVLGFFTNLVLKKSKLIPSSVQGMILRAAFDGISEEIIDLKSKMMICEEAGIEFIRLTYEDKPFTLSKNRFNGTISFDQYKMFKNKLASIGKYDPILLKLGLIEQYAKDRKEIASLSTEVRKLYLEGQYDLALELLNHGLDDIFAQEEKIDPDKYSDFKSHIFAARFDFYQSEPNSNDDCRRFFENRLAQLYFGRYVNVESSAKIIQYFTDTKPRDVEEIEYVMLYLTEMSNKYSAKNSELKKASKLYKDKVDDLRRNFKTEFDERNGYVVAQVNDDPTFSGGGNILCRFCIF